MARRCAIIPFDRNPPLGSAAGAVPQRWPRSRRTPWGYCGLRPEDATSIGRSLVEPRTTPSRPHAPSRGRSPQRSRKLLVQPGQLHLFLAA
jgi:hypothetical protein